jgi:catechol 2,3-dioxygenase-like lactoylglutathione lyase family enzyme
MINGVHHVSISTPDLDRALAFYRDVLGFEQRFEMSWEVGNDLADRIVGLKDSAARGGMVNAGNLYIEFWEYSSPTPAPADPDRRPCDHGLTHICFDINNIDAEHARLSAAGMSFAGPPIALPEAGCKAIYGRDPDGNVIELQEIVNAVEGAVPSLPAGVAS